MATRAGKQGLFGRTGCIVPGCRRTFPKDAPHLLVICRRCMTSVERAFRDRFRAGKAGVRRARTKRYAAGLLRAAPHLPRRQLARVRSLVEVGHLVDEGVAFRRIQHEAGINLAMGVR